MNHPPSRKTTGSGRWLFLPAGEQAAWVRDWDDLNRRSHRSPLLQTWFLLPALRHFGTGNETVAVRRDGDDQVCAMLLLSPPRGTRRRAFKPSQIPISPILLAPGEDLVETIRSLLKVLPRSILGIHLMHCDERLIAMPEAALDVEVTVHMETGSTFIGQNFSDYHARIPVRARQNLERRIRKAEKEVGTVTLQVCGDAARIDEFLELYSATELKGWKGKAGTAIRPESSQGHFYRDILTAAAGQGSLRTFVLMFGSTPVAQQIAIDFEGITYFLKTTFDGDFRAYSPGSIQHHRILEWSHAQTPPTRDSEIYGEIKQSTAPFITSQRRVYHLTVFRYGVMRPALDLWRRMKKSATSDHRPSIS